MTPHVPSEPRYWLLITDVPAGPFDAATIRTKWSAGEIDSLVKVCRAGDSTWKAISEVPDLANDVPGPPVAPTSELACSANDAKSTPKPSELLDLPDDPAPSNSPRPKNPPTTDHPWAAIVGVVVLLIGGYVVYEAIRPLTPREVVEHMIDAEKAADAKKYVTRAMEPVMDAMDAVPDSSFHDEASEIVRDEEAPTGVGGHYVWVRVTAFDPDVGRRIPMEMRCHVVKTDGWKVADMELLSYDGQQAEQPVSLVKEYRRIFPPASSANASAGKTGSNSSPSTAQKGAVFGLWALIKSGGAKAVGVCVLGILAALWALLRNANKAKT